MTSKLYFQDDSIQLVEINSVQSPCSLNKLKKKNRIDSPTLSENMSTSTNSKISDIFVVKKPIPAPRQLKALHSKENLTKSSDTLDTISGDVQSIFSNKSDNLSYKEKLRNRFLSIKKQAECTITDRGKTKLNKQKKLRESVEALLQKEESVLSEELSKYNEQKFEWNVQQKNEFDFFCKIQEDEKENKDVDKSEQIKSDEDGDGKKSVSEFLGIEHIDSTVVENIFPFIVDYSINEKDVFLIKKHRIRSDNESGLILRNYEEEGIYVPNLNHISKYQLADLENRLYFDDKIDWFNSDGRLKIVPDPRLEHSVKPIESSITHESFINKYIPPTLYEPAENYINIYENTLEVFINNVTFKHHSLFSKEHILQQVLIDLYEEYNMLINENVLSISSKKLDALRAAKSLLEDTIQESNDCSESQLERYEKYITDIKNMREIIYVEGLKERTLKKQILIIWKSIKDIRNIQQYSSTCIKLVINKEITNYENEKQIWEQNLLFEVNEIIEELENKYQTEINEYKIKLKQWKDQKTNDDESENSEEVKKPRKPKKNFNEEEIKENVARKMNECLKPPGEPNIDFDLKYENNISEHVENRKEIQRRNEVCKLKIFIKILYNNYEVCKTKLVQLNDNFVCNFNEQIAIKLYKVPQKLTLQIFEQSTQINKRLLSETTLRIPAFQSTFLEAENQFVTFTNNDILTHHHLGLGTGIELNKICQLNDFNDRKLFTNGHIQCKLGWILDKNYENILDYSKSDFNLIPTLFDIENLETWIKKYPDPLDPNNAPFYEYINTVKQNISEVNYFRLNPDVKSLEFCSSSEMNSNRRFKLLQLRFNNEPEFKNIVVPNRIKEINEDMFTEYENRRKEEIITPEILTEQTSIDMQRKYTKKYLLQAENHIIQLAKIADRKISLKDVINEEFIPSFGSLSSSFLNWLQPKRPLRPKRKQNVNVSSQISFKQFNILINIIGAIQVPHRKEYATSIDFTSNSSLKSNLSHISVRPFVTASFKDVCAKTTVAEGSNPVWNQELSLTIKNNENFTLQSLQNINECLVINLYDETVDDLIIDDRIRETNIHQHLGCNWLGNLEIPFKTLLVNNRIEGTFKINLPAVLLGYERQNIKTFHESGEILNQKIDTFLTVFITLLPSVPNIQPDIQIDLECIESEYITDFINNWQLEYNHLFPNRKFSSFITTLTGEKCCITRLFKEIKLPDLHLNEFATIKLVKYVSLIPFHENTNSGIIPDIWLQPEQLLSLMMGSIKDHSVLLTCYFMSLEINSWLLLGYSLLDTYTTYVLTKEKIDYNYEFFIYDIKTAKKYNIYESNCPLQKVFCIINDQNVWANIQIDDRIHQTKFDVSKSSDWLPLFNKDISAPANLKQTNITYSEPASVILLQEKIEKKLRKKLMKWRKFSRTTFNHYCNAAFKKILAKLEYKITDNPESLEHFPEIQNLMCSYEIRGFAKSFPYTNINDLIDFVQKTGIHLNDNPNIEFSLSVYVHSYNNNAVIVWLFIATLNRKRSINI